MYVIETHGLSKSYGRHTVLGDVNLAVPRGSMFGFLGPNGAGKSTTIRILMGLLRSSGGQARILGRDVWRDGASVRAEIGYLPGDIRFNDFWTGRETLHFLTLARGGRGKDEVRRLATRFDLALNQRIRSYSRGMRQKLGLIQALAHRPQVLILDEPTTALDPLVQQTLFDELRAATAEGRTVLFSSHTLSEVEQLCDHVAILRGGRLIEQGAIGELRRRELRHVELTFADAISAERFAPPQALRVFERSGASVRGSWTGSVSDLLSWLPTQTLADVQISAPSLEDLFLSYYDRTAPAGTTHPIAAASRAAGVTEGGNA
jgi:ABC-2 type transport system ATP-binding protein